MAVGVNCFDGTLRHALGRGERILVAFRARLNGGSEVPRMKGGPVWPSLCQGRMSNVEQGMSNVEVRRGCERRSPEVPRTAPETTDGERNREDHGGAHAETQRPRRGSRVIGTHG